MRKLFLILFLVFSLGLHSQNWNVFNKNYRYNYKFNNSPLISNVLFADTVKQTGADTAYSMNNIGVVTGSVLTVKKPQFLMKKIIKLANGNVKLQDTTNILIIPHCALNQSWLFDWNYNLIATCVATSTETIFNQIDSVKIIIVNNVDSIKLSKRFGLIQFPKLYAQNSYYRLVGIEDGTKYDTISLFGERVPNAWDFYNFEIGKQFCRSSDRGDNMGSGYVFSCYRNVDVIQSKTLTATGYSYGIYRISKSSSSSIVQNYCSSPFVPTTTLNVIEQYSALTSKTITENRMYPGMVGSEYSISNVVNVTKFGLSSNGVFVKYFGPTCSTVGISLPNTNTESGYYSPVSPALTYSFNPNYPLMALSYGASLGKLDSRYAGFEHGYDYCTACYGTVEHKEHEKISVTENIYPNPANSAITIPVDNCKLFIYDIFGKAILTESIENKRSLDVSNVPNGIYFIEIQSDSGKYSQKLIIQH